VEGEVSVSAPMLTADELREIEAAAAKATV
jgi:hypothetical protein